MKIYLNSALWLLSWSKMTLFYHHPTKNDYKPINYIFIVNSFFPNDQWDPRKWVSPVKQGLWNPHTHINIYMCEYIFIHISTWLIKYQIPWYIFWYLWNDILNIDICIYIQGSCGLLLYKEYIHDNIMIIQNYSHPISVPSLTAESCQVKQGCWINHQFIKPSEMCTLTMTQVCLYNS